MGRFDRLSRDELIRLLVESEMLLQDFAEKNSHFLLQDLQLHKIELEIQNRDLRESQQALEESHDRYAQLYDFAPVGYLTLDPKGVIRQINLTAAAMLGQERAGLTDKPFGTFLASGTSHALFAHLHQVFTSSKQAEGKFSLKADSNGRIKVVRADSSVQTDVDGEKVCLMSLTDVTDYLQLMDELAERELSYAHLAQHDSLTGLPNRLLFADRLSQAMHMSHRNASRLAVMFIDLDRFKQVNDRFGHDLGDQILTLVTMRLQGLFREEDTIARMGGDEFTVILNNIQQDEHAALVATKILQLFEEPFEIRDQVLYLGASIGISVYPGQGTSVDELVRNADAAMYRAKEEGRGTFHYYSEELTARASERILLETSLHNAVDRRELILHYQPQVDLASGDLCGLEALVRWQHPEMGLVQPAQFIPLAEESGIVIPMGKWILHEACRQMKAWQEADVLPQNALISVNLSGKQFDQSNLIQQIDRILDDTGLESANLELEITESIMMRSTDVAGNILIRLRQMGINLAIDDFGTGYSSLNYLKRLPITRIKIDRSFVSDIPLDFNDVAITKAIFAMARSLSLDVLAEGIETREQESFLAREGCHKGQGYLFSKPLPAVEFEAFTRQQRR